MNTSTEIGNSITVLKNNQNLHLKTWPITGWTWCNWFLSGESNYFLGQCEHWKYGQRRRWVHSSDTTDKTLAIKMKNYKKYIFEHFYGRIQLFPCWCYFFKLKVNFFYKSHLHDEIFCYNSVHHYKTQLRFWFC